jgi:phosphoribosylglycinamide formyltransferase-1
VSLLAVLASGNGSNFEALVGALRSRPVESGPRHECVLLVYDRKAAFAAERARRLGIPSRYVSYYKREASEAEAEIAAALGEARVDLAALAGFMRMLSPSFVAARAGRIVNVHPSLLPKWPGAHSIERAFRSGERDFGVTVHRVDEGMDTGEVIESESFRSESEETLEEIEARVHVVEHRVYPRAVLRILDELETKRGRP